LSQLIPTFASISHPGLKHNENQDACACLGPTALPNGESATLLLLADGIGGHEHGKQAALSVINTLTEHFRDHLPEESLCAWLQDAVLHAHSRICAEGKADTPGNRRGATLTALLIVGQYACSVSIGDCRLYRARDGFLTQLSNDQTSEGKLTQALGFNVTVETQPLALAAGDQLIICSDGLYRELSDQMMLKCISHSKPDHALERMLDMALQQGGHDNISVILVSVDKDRKKNPVKTILLIVIVSIIFFSLLILFMNNNSRSNRTGETEKHESFPSIAPQEDLSFSDTSEKTLSELDKQSSDLIRKADQTIEQYKIKGYPEKIESLEQLRLNLQQTQTEIKQLKSKLGSADSEKLKTLQKQLSDTNFNLSWMYRDAVVLPNRLEKPASPQ
jgi:serine/threonine protein phosphatase PrpC